MDLANEFAFLQNTQLTGRITTEKLQLSTIGTSPCYSKNNSYIYFQRTMIITNWDFVAGFCLTTTRLTEWAKGSFWLDQSSSFHLLQQ